MSESDATPTDQTTSPNKTSDSQTKRKTAGERARRRRLRRMKILVVLFPFLMVGVLELVFRLVGAYESPEVKAKAKLQVMDLPPGTSFFPEWDQQVVVPKPANTKRLFVLGGSSAMGFGVDRPFSQRLQTLLNETAPGHKWEVFNGAVSAYGSQRVLAILKRAVEFEPDLIVVYLGHNEFLEDVFYDPDGVLGRIERATTFARKIRVVNFVRSFFRSKKKPRSKPKLQQHFFGNTKFPLIHSQPEKQARIDFLAANLQEMAEHCRKHDAQLVLIPAATNLLSPPGDPQHGWEAENNAWHDVMEQSRTAMMKRDYGEVDRLAQRLIEMDTRHAGGHYLAGLAAMGQEEFSRGESELNQALRLDWRGDRAGPAIQTTILNAPKNDNTVSIDVRPDFGRRMPVDFKLVAKGKRLTMFLDHCHPSQDGHDLIARLCLPVVLKRLGITPN